MTGHRCHDMFIVCHVMTDHRSVCQICLIIQLSIESDSCQQEHSTVATPILSVVVPFYSSNTNFVALQWYACRGICILTLNCEKQIWRCESKPWSPTPLAPKSLHKHQFSNSMVWLSNCTIRPKVKGQTLERVAGWCQRVAPVTSFDKTPSPIPYKGKIIM